MNEDTFDLMTTEEFAKLRRTTRGVLAVERCQRRDHPPYLKVSRKILYRKSDVLRWLEAHRVDPSGEGARG